MKQKIFLFVVPPNGINRKKKEKTHELLQKELGEISTWGFNFEPKNAKHKEHVLDAIGIANWHLKKEFTGD